ncbi:MAG: hypothetical protein ACPL28_12195 [bacterium]
MAIENKVPRLRTYLEALDTYLANNLSTLTCADILNIHKDTCWQDARNFLGTTSGITWWFSEVLFLRILLKQIEQLGGKFERQERGTTHDIDSLVNPTLNIEVCPQLGLNLPSLSRSWRPDITVCQGIGQERTPRAVLEVKTWLTSTSAVDCLIKKIEAVLTDYRDIRVAFIYFSQFAEEDRQRFKEIEREFGRFLALSLTADQDRMVGKALEEGLGLYELRATNY